MGKGLTEEEMALIRRMAARSMNVSAVAKDMYASRSSTVYRLDRIWKKTGRDPRSFSDLVELLEMTEGGGGDGE